MSYTKVPVFNEGDLIEAVKGDTVIGGRVSLALGGRVIIGESSRSVGVLETEGFTVTVIERAKPKLPTEPGVYLPYLHSGGTTSVPNIWLLDGDAWISLPNAAGHKTERLEASRVQMSAETMVRLEAPGVTARKVFERIYERYGENYFHNSNEAWNDVAREFGVSA